MYLSLCLLGVTIPAAISSSSGLRGNTLNHRFFDDDIEYFDARELAFMEGILRARTDESAAAGSAGNHHGNGGQQARVKCVHSWIPRLNSYQVWVGDKDQKETILLMHKIRGGIRNQFQFELQPSRFSDDGTTGTLVFEFLVAEGVSMDATATGFYKSVEAYCKSLR